MRTLLYSLLLCSHIACAVPQTYEQLMLFSDSSNRCRLLLNIRADKPTILHNAPRGEEKSRLPYSKQPQTVVLVTDAARDWFHIVGWADPSTIAWTYATPGNLPGSWLHNSAVWIEEISSGTTLYAAPDENAAELGHLPAVRPDEERRIQKLLDCQGGWLRVRALDDEDEQLEGWIAPDSQCTLVRQPCP